MEQEFEWDERKCELNFAKHGIQFEDAARVWNGPVLHRVSYRAGEARILTIGWFEGRAIAVIWVFREKRRRIISARVARRRERDDYARYVEATAGS